MDTSSGLVNLRGRWLLVFLAVLCLGLPARAQDNKGTKVAVVNLNKVFNTIDEVKALNDKLQKDKEEYDREQKTRTASIDKIQNELDQLNPDSEQYDAKNKELLNAKAQLQAWYEVMNADLQHRKKVQMKTLIEKIQAAVGDVAQQRGIDLVVADQSIELPANLDSVNWDQLRALINQRNILYAAKGVDITEAVILQLNNKYHSR
jgi:Skp family chaperone for outer membrane proteins